MDLNVDMGESFGRYKLGNDEEVMKYITSANVACGFHAGDPLVMTTTVELAKQYGVAVGAHTGLEGYTRLRAQKTRYYARRIEERYSVSTWGARCHPEGERHDHAARKTAWDIVPDGFRRG